jgi:hypothetical protein
MRIRTSKNRGVKKTARRDVVEEFGTTGKQEISFAS